MPCTYFTRYKKRSSRQHTLFVKMENFLGKRYKLESSQNFDEYMKALGVDAAIREIGVTLTPEVELTENDGVYTLRTISNFKTQEIVFRLGEEFLEETLDGRKVMSVFTLSGNVLSQSQKTDDRTLTITREFSESQVKATMPIDDIICFRTFKLVD